MAGDRRARTADCPFVDADPQALFTSVDITWLRVLDFLVSYLIVFTPKRYGRWCNGVGLSSLPIGAMNLLLLWVMIGVNSMLFAVWFAEQKATKAVGSSGPGRGEAAGSTNRSDLTTSVSNGVRTVQRGLLDQLHCHARSQHQRLMSLTHSQPVKSNKEESHDTTAAVETTQGWGWHHGASVTRRARN